MSCTIGDRELELLRRLFQEVRAIPYYCGREDCNHPGCLEIRKARATVLEITNDTVLREPLWLAR